MLVFRDGKSRVSHAYSASAAVLEIVAELNKRNRKVKGGIASGLVVSGRIGSRLGKLDYTAIGDTVNLSARLKTQAVKAGKTGIIIAPSTIRKLKGLARVEFVERISIKGKSREYPLYELLELRKNTNV
jgi:class 3 adenylate cyclase